MSLRQINGSGSRTEKSESNLPSTSYPNKYPFIKSLNHYQNLFEKLDGFYQKFGLKNELNIEKNREDYLNLSAQLYQEIENQKYLLCRQQNLSERYENLFKKYAEKLKKPNLTPKQRMRYEKLSIQYSMLYMEYSHQ